VAKSTVSVLDVGHGNCTVVADTAGVVVIDAGPGPTLLEFLEKERIGKVDVIAISHADEDHIKGLISLLESARVSVDVVRLNSDAMKGSATWLDLTFVLNGLNREGRVRFDVGLTTNDTGSFDQGIVHIEVLAPTPGLAARGPGSRDYKGRRLTSNSMSAVFRLIRGARPIMLLPGDVDEVGLENLIDTTPDTKAEIAVFPHHAGATRASDLSRFATRFTEAASPKNVIFSIGRGRYATPRPEVVVAVRTAAPQVRILCTQLSEHCSSAVPVDDPSHLFDGISKGRESRKCCAGTIVFSVDGPDLSLCPTLDSHREFIAIAAPSALCMRNLQY